jgi:hypothetical protein
VGVTEPPELVIDVLPMLVDFTVTPVVEVALRYDDDANGVHATETFALTARDAMRWSVPLKDPDLTRFKYKVTYNCADGTVIEREEAEAPDPKITLPKLIVPEVVSVMVPKLVDYVQTPVVEVNLQYADPARGVDVHKTYSFTDATQQEFRLQVDARASRSYAVEITYYLANGQVVTREPVTVDKTQIIIPKYLAAA